MQTGTFDAKTISKLGTWNVRTLCEGGKLAQLLHEFDSYNLDILGISKMRWTGLGKIVSDGKSVLYSGHEEHHIHGVGLVLSKKASCALLGWKPVNDRIITARFQSRHAKTSIIQVYAPTEDSDDDQKDTFYGLLQDTIDEILTHDVKLLIGDFNAQITDDRRGLENVIALLDVRAYRGADVGSDHYLVRSSIRLRIKRREQKQRQHPYGVEKLKEPAVVQQFQLELRNRFELLQDAGDIDEYWMAFKQAVIETVKEIMGCRCGTQKKRWIRGPTWSLIDKRKIAKCRHEQAKADPDKETTAERYRQLDRAVKRSCKSDKKAWVECKGAKVHEAASKNDNKMLYRIVLELTGAWGNSSAPIKNKDGVFLLTREEQDARWVEHFKETLNQSTPANTYDFGATPPPPDLVVSLDLITIEETKVAIRTLKANKAPGLDEIAPEMLKHGGDTIVNTLIVLLNKCWQDQSVPSDWRKEVIVKLPKKGNTADCNNWRGITLLLVPGKVFCSVLLRRLQQAEDEILREEQAGFREGRSCSEQIYTLRNIIEQCIEFQRPLLINFIDFKKAFDSVHRGSFGKFYEPTAFHNGLSTSSRTYISALAAASGQTMATQTSSTSKPESSKDVSYDIALLANTKPPLQSMTTCLEGEAEKVGLRINTDKTKVMRVNHQTKMQITIAQQTVEDIDEFTYLGSI
ncbi:hypothetical protein P4O66_007096, partial [Electrophorus voltai]